MSLNVQNYSRIYKNELKKAFKTKINKNILDTYLF